MARRITPTSDFAPNKSVEKTISAVQHHVEQPHVHTQTRFFQQVVYCTLLAQREHCMRFRVHFSDIQKESIHKGNIHKENIQKKNEQKKPEYAAIIFAKEQSINDVNRTSESIYGTLATAQSSNVESNIFIVHGSVSSLVDTEQVRKEIQASVRNSEQQTVDFRLLHQIQVEISEADLLTLSKLSQGQSGKKKQGVAIHEIHLSSALHAHFYCEFQMQNRQEVLPDIFSKRLPNMVEDTTTILTQTIFTMLEQLLLQHIGQKNSPVARRRYKHENSIKTAKENERTSTVSVDEIRHVAIHLEKSQFGRTQPDPMSIMTVIHDTEVLQKAQDNNIELIGIDPSWNGFRAIAALQKALTRQGYKPEPEFIEIIGDEEIATAQGMVVQSVVKRIPNPMYNDEINSIRRAFKYQDGLPRLVYKSWTEYYDDFGVPKYETERGKIEYNGKIKLEAEEALAALVKNAFVWNYIRVRNPKTPHEVREDVTAYAPLIAAVQVVRNEISKELEYIEIIPSPVIVDQVSTHFLIYPSDLENQVYRALNAKGKGRPPRYQLLFVKWLYLRAKENNLRPFSNTYRELGRILRMDAWIDTRQDKRVRDSLEKCFMVALNLGLVVNIYRSQDKFTFYLNPEKFRRKTPQESTSQEFTE